MLAVVVVLGALILVSMVQEFFENPYSPWNASKYSDEKRAYFKRISLNQRDCRNDYPASGTWL